MYRFIIDLGFEKFRAKNLQMVITFDREFGLRRFKNESLPKWCNEAYGQSQKGFEIQNFIVYYFFFIFLVFFTFFFISPIYTCQKTRGIVVVFPCRD